MRKKFVLFLFIPLVLLCLTVYIFIDGWVESGLESAGEGIVGAKVEIDNLRISLSPIAVQFSRLQVANPRNPWNNVFETGKVRFALNFGQLLRGNYIIETMEVNGLVLGTKRSSDGSLPKPVVRPGESSILSQATAALVSEAQKAPVFDLGKIRKELKIDSLLNVQNLRTVQYVDTLKRRVQESSQVWQSTLNDIEKSKQRIADIQANITAINVNELKTVESITAAIGNANNAYKGLNELNETFKNRRTSVTDQINRLSASARTIDDLARADYETVRRLARLPDLSTQGIAKLLIGREILQTVNTYMSYADYARNTIPKYTPTPEYEKPARLKGQDIRFPAERSYPKWWIQKILISGGEDKNQNPDYFYATGEVRNISDNQQLSGFPLTIALAAAKTGGSRFTVDASFDRRPDIPVDRYRVTASDLPSGDISFGQSDFVPSRITGGMINASAEATVPGDRLDTNVKMVFRNLSLAFDRAPQNDVERITRDVLSSISGFHVGLRMWNTSGPLDVALSTDLDDQLAARTKKVIGDELARLQNDIRSKVDQAIAAKRAEFDKIFNQKKEEALSQLRSYETLVNQNLSMLDGKKKVLEARIDQAKKKGLEDALKGLFRK
jgi:uncharacterized protein (TIGR03545 family)